MTEVNELLIRTLKDSGYSVTTVRKQVFQALDQKEPLEMRNIVAALPGVDKVSIYRTIALFEKLGIVHRLQIGWKYKLELTDTFSYHHHHLTCRQCGKVISLPENAILETSLHALANQHGYRDLSHQLEITGICPACQKQNLQGL